MDFLTEWTEPLFKYRPQSAFPDGPKYQTERKTIGMKPVLRLSKDNLISIEVTNDGECPTKLGRGSGCANLPANLIEEITIASKPPAFRSAPSACFEDNTNNPDRHLYQEIAGDSFEQVQLEEVSTAMNYITPLKVVEIIPPVQSPSCKKCRKHEIKVKYSFTCTI
jgi:hypothetical protein